MIYVRPCVVKSQLKVKKITTPGDRGRRGNKDAAPLVGPVLLRSIPPPMTGALHCLQAVASAWSRGENNSCAFVLYRRQLRCVPPQTLSSRSAGWLLVCQRCDKSMSSGVRLRVRSDVRWVRETCWSPVCQSSHCTGVAGGL